MPTHKCHDISIYYEIHGSGFPVLFISGLGAGTWAWEAQLSFFAHHYQAIVFDNRGAGQTTAPEGPYSIEQMALDTTRLVHALQVDKLFVVGLSMGGMIAQELALLLPHRIQGLVLAATHAGGHMRVPGPQDAYDRLMDNSGLSAEQILDKNISILFSPVTREERPQVVEAYRRQQHEIPAQAAYAFRAQQQAIESFDFSERLADIQAPTLILAGSQDLLIPLENAHRLAAHIPDSRLRTLTPAGHLVHLEQAQAFNQEVHHFFQTILNSETGSA